MLFIGIDLGTSACKLLLVGENGTIQNEVTREYPLIFPHPGWSEQRPEDWWNAVVAGVPELLRGFDASQVVGIGAGGQMHGLVALDAQDSVIRPAILWNDGRTFKEVDYLNNTIGKERLSALTANIAFAGFTAPKLLWMRENEPENFKKIAKIMLPKDYVNYKLTGVHCCDYSDASGMLLLDVAHKRWSQEMLDICGISECQMPKLFESFEVVGTLTKKAAQTLGLPETVKVVAGAAITPLLRSAQEQSARAAAISRSVRPGRSSFRPTNSALTPTMRFTLLPTPTAATISWAVCSLLPAATSGCAKKFSKRPISRVNRRILPTKNSVKITFTSCRI